MISGHTLTYEGPRSSSTTNRSRAQGAGPRRRREVLRPGRRHLPVRRADHRCPERAVDVAGRHRLVGAVVPRGRPTTPVVLRATVQPLIIWLWIGGIVMAVGTAAGRRARSNGRGIRSRRPPSRRRPKPPAHARGVSWHEPPLAPTAAPRSGSSCRSPSRSSLLIVLLATGDPASERAVNSTARSASIAPLIEGEDLDGPVVRHRRPPGPVGRRQLLLDHVCAVHRRASRTRRVRRTPCGHRRRRRRVRRVRRLGRRTCVTSSSSTAATGR